MGNVTIRQAKPDDWEAIAALLTLADLPLAGAQERLGEFVTLKDDEDGALLACAALERYPADAPDARASGLLRSVAVAPDARGRGLAARLVTSLLAGASGAECADVTLLTTSAADYFTRFGFRAIPRDQTPAPIRASLEFREACPDSATVMTLKL